MKVKLAFILLIIGNDFISTHCSISSLLVINAVSLEGQHNWLREMEENLLKMGYDVTSLNCFSDAPDDLHFFYIEYTEAETESSIEYPIEIQRSHPWEITFNFNDTNDLRDCEMKTISIPGPMTALDNYSDEFEVTESYVKLRSHEKLILQNLDRHLIADATKKILNLFLNRKAARIRTISIRDGEEIATDLSVCYIKLMFMHQNMSDAEDQHNTTFLMLLQKNLPFDVMLLFVLCMTVICYLLFIYS